MTVLSGPSLSWFSLFLETTTYRVSTSTYGARLSSPRRLSFLIRGFRSGGSGFICFYSSSEIRRISDNSFILMIHTNIIYHRASLQQIPSPAFLNHVTAVIPKQTRATSCAHYDKLIFL